MSSILQMKTESKCFKMKNDKRRLSRKSRHTGKRTLSLWPFLALKDYYRKIFPFLATFFLEHWKRKQSEVQYDWDLIGYEDEEVLYIISYTILIHYIPVPYFYDVIVINFLFSSYLFFIALWDSPAGKIANTGGVSFYWIGIQYAMPYS